MAEHSTVKTLSWTPGLTDERQPLDDVTIHHIYLEDVWLAYMFRVEVEQVKFVVARCVEHRDLRRGNVVFLLQPCRYFFSLYLREPAEDNLDEFLGLTRMSVIADFHGIKKLDEQRTV